MKKIALTLTLLFTAALVWAGKPAKVQNLINEFRHYEGFESVSVGPLGLALAKAVILSDDDLDGEDRAFIKSFDSIRRISILDFEDGAAEIKERFVARVKKVLNGMSLILEMKDDGDRLSIYGNEKDGTIRDCVLFDPSGTLICVRGTVSVDNLVAAVNHD
jgi:hypothetical protein